MGHYGNNKIAQISAAAMKTQQKPGKLICESISVLKKIMQTVNIGKESSWLHTVMCVGGCGCDKWIVLRQVGHKSGRSSL